MTVPGRQDGGLAEYLGQQFPEKVCRHLVNVRELSQIGIYYVHAKE